MFSLLSKLFGSRTDRIIKDYKVILENVNSYEAAFSALLDTDFPLKTQELKEQVKSGKSLNDILPEAFALVREASKRTLGMRHFDVQILGGIALHNGKIAEMRTGEGKTLVATLPAYLNALAGDTVYVVSVNDYLVKRDAETMGQIYRFLGLDVGYVINNMDQNERVKQYHKNIVYVENKEIGFDYLRDNMRMDANFCLIDRPLRYAIIDEVDSVLIDEARTPLIISGAVEQDIGLYNVVNKIVRNITPDFYEIEEKTKQVHIKDNYYTQIEDIVRSFNLIGADETLYGLEGVVETIEDPVRQIFKSRLIHLIQQCLKANLLFKENVDYLIKDRQVFIIDEFTGRVMQGRRYSDGLHQALEAKHNLPIQQETQTVSSITYQNLFRLFNKLAGMTGTAMTEATEFEQIYGLEVLPIPTNMPVRRRDENDTIYRTEKEKFQAIVDLVKELHNKGQPVLIGAASIDKSEILATYLKQANLPFNLLNAKNHEIEAYIIAEAGRKKAITIATNMAGRGTDIVLGGNLEARIKREVANIRDEDLKKSTIEKIRAEWNTEASEVKELGGLYVLGSERHESRRIDNQLRGRSGRQGDLGVSKFFMSLEDDLLRIFGGISAQGILSKVGFKEGESIDHPLLNRVIETAQKKVENYNYEIRKNLMKYDDILSNQRKTIYQKRYETLINAANYEEIYLENINKVASKIALKASQSILENPDNQSQIYKNFQNDIRRIFAVDVPDEALENDNLPQVLEKIFVDKYKAVLAGLTPQDVPAVQRHCLLSSIDYCWKNHLYEVEHIRHSINLKAYAQKDPFMEYKIELFELFISTLEQIDELSLIKIFSLRIVHENKANSGL